MFVAKMKPDFADDKKKEMMEKEYYSLNRERYHLQWVETVKKNSTKMFEVKDARAKQVDRISEDILVGGERVLMFRGALPKGCVTIELRNLKKYGNWEKNKKILLDMIAEVDDIEIPKKESKLVENVDKRLKEVRSRQDDIAKVLWP